MREEAKILLFGPNGQIGWELCRTLTPLGTVITAGIEDADHQLDIADIKAMRELVRQIQPQLIINATAYTAVDQAESEPEQARRINAEAVGHMGKIAAAQDCPIVHYSTDYVFSGQKQRAWSPQDTPRPINMYGKTKLVGEQLLMHSNADYLIIRTAWLYSNRNQNFLLTMRRLMQEKDQLRVVDDQIGTPTWARLVAEATAGLLIQCQSPPNRFYFGPKGGIYHLTCDGQASWYEFAQAIRELSDYDCQIEAIKTEDYPTPAKRPAYSVLDNNDIRSTFGIRLPHWRHALKLCLEELKWCQNNN